MEKNLDITNPRYNEPISPVPWHFVKSRFHCIVQGRQDGEALVFKGIPYAILPVKEQRWKPPIPWKRTLAGEERLMQVNLETFVPNKIY